MIEDKEMKKELVKKHIINSIVAFLIIGIISTCYKCPSKYVFGIPCPGCGMTRALIALCTLDIEQAMYYHPLCVMVVVIGLILALDYWKVINVSKKIRTGILFTGGIVMIAVFIWRIHNGSPIVAIDFENSILYKKIISRLL